MRFFFIVNARSGRQRARKPLDELIESNCRSAAVDFRLVPATGIEDLDTLIPEAIENGFDVVCAVGGDGTVSEIGRRLIGTSTALGIVPTGSGNGLARHLGIPMAFAAAMRVLQAGTIRRIDTALVNGLPYLATCGFGLDAEVAHRFAASPHRGLTTYLEQGVRAWLGRRSIPIRVRIDDDREFDAGVLIATAANANQFGNEARIAPTASIEDGRLDLVLVRNPPYPSIPLMLYRLFRGTFDRSPGVTTLRGSAIEISRPTAGRAHIDGEPVDLPASLRFEVRPSSLSVITPVRGPL